MADSNTFARGRTAAPGAVTIPHADLSAEISQFLDRQPGDDVRCTHVCNDNYRCNWWSPLATAGYDNPGMSGLLVTTHRVRKSRFLHVTKTGDRLIIHEQIPAPVDEAK